MISKTLGTFLIVIACILMFPIAFAIIGGVFGIIFGVIGGVFGAVFGIMGGVFGAIFGFFEWLLDGLFGWHHGPAFFWSWNPFTVLLFVVIIALIVRSQSKRKEKDPN